MDSIELSGVSGIFVGIFNSCEINHALFIAWSIYFE